MNARVRGANGTFILHLLNSTRANLTGCSVVYVFGCDGFRSENHLKRRSGLNPSETNTPRGQNRGRAADLPNDVLALVAHRSPGTRWHVLGPLHDGVEVLWMRLRGGAVVTFRSSAACFAK